MNEKILATNLGSYAPPPTYLSYDQLFDHPKMNKKDELFSEYQA